MLRLEQFGNRLVYALGGGNIVSGKHFLEIFNEGARNDREIYEK